MTLQKRSCFFLFIDTAAAVALFSFFSWKMLEVVEISTIIWYNFIRNCDKPKKWQLLSILWLRIGKSYNKVTMWCPLLGAFTQRKKRAFPDSPYLLSIEISIRSFRFPQEIARVSTLQQRCQDRRKLLTEISLQQTRKCCAMSCLILSHLVNSAAAPLGRNVGISINVVL